MGRLLDAEELVPDLIVSSSAVRAQRTAEAVAKAGGFAGSIVLTDALYHAHPDTIIDVVREMDDEHACVMVVGHNPGHELLLTDLCGQWERFPTAALAQIQLPIDRWAELDESTTGALVNLWRPKERGRTLNSE